MGSWEGVWQQLGHLSRPGWVVTEGGGSVAQWRAQGTLDRLRARGQGRAT